MRDPLLAAWQTTPVSMVPEFDVKAIASVYSTCASSYKKRSNVDVSERAAILRRAADTMLQQTPQLYDLLVKEAHKTWGDAAAEVREAVDFLR